MIVHNLCYKILREAIWFSHLLRVLDYGVIWFLVILIYVANKIIRAIPLLKCSNLKITSVKSSMMKVRRHSASNVLGWCTAFNMLRPEALKMVIVSRDLLHVWERNSLNIFAQDVSLIISNLLFFSRITKSDKERSKIVLFQNRSLFKFGTKSNGFKIV